ncbi:LysR family substrate-binding domain-containing protein [Kitasatospora cineracea]|uniref:LysR substrate binding domain-containing protein n=1 Tax=Kitasatospora cineracea TaxID=88074 RepID=A0A8G1UBU5_9ACTN|nr:LysR family substrate-binding domain-containing protein [Kitasatospora cineracea]ROR37885.1 LysR substrate binding domain-containing protein [Kitasatospora cineracea]
MTETEQPEQSPASFRLVYVPGVTPTKWLRVWEERLPDTPVELLQSAPADGHALLLSGGADAGLVRLPVDRTVLSAIPLYTETTVVVFPKDHWLAAAEEVTAADLAEEVVFHPQDDTLDWPELPGRPAFERPATTGDAIELVAANVGVLAVPQSLARLHHRRDLTYRTLVDVPQSQVALAWPEDATTDLVEEFIGIVRGRTANSSRGRTAAAEEQRRPSSTKKSKAQPQQRTGQGGSGKPKPTPGRRTGGGRTAQPKRGGSGGGRKK